jgi:mercuric ion transport protein
MNNGQDKNRKLLRTGIIGTVIAAICCFTPVLVVLLSALGLAAWAGWLDYVLIPTLVFFIGLTGYAYYRQRQQKAAECCPSDERESG